MVAYMVLVLLICLLFVNMQIGVVITTFNNEKESTNMNRLLEPQEKDWIQMQNITYQLQPQKELKPGEQNTCIRNLCMHISRHRHFDNFIMVCILLNTVVLALTWFDEPDIVPDITEMANYVFMVIFTIEAIIKIIALKSTYFKDSWNIFDFVIVSLTLLLLFFKVINFNVEFGNGATILRALRIGRILRLLKKAY